MKYYDIAISLGQYCITSTALRRNNLQAESMIFDWSAGILFDVCGLGGLEGKVNLICNDFKDFFNLEDLENRGNNQENDTYNLWIVNKRTGLQYKHDFPAWQPVEEAYPFVKARLDRRIKRLYSEIESSDRVLFCFFARDIGFTDELLIEQQVKLARKFPNKGIDFLYILQNSSYSVDKYDICDLNDNVKKIEMNFIHPTDPVYPESWNGNTEIYYPILRKLFFTKATVPLLNKSLYQLENQYARISSELTEYKIMYDSLSVKLVEINEKYENINLKLDVYKEKIDFFERKPSSLEQIFSIKNEFNHKVIRILGIKMKFKKLKK